MILEMIILVAVLILVVSCRTRGTTEHRPVSPGWTIAALFAAALGIFLLLGGPLAMAGRQSQLRATTRGGGR